MNNVEAYCVVAAMLLGAIILLPGLILAAPFFAIGLWILGRAERD